MGKIRSASPPKTVIAIAASRVGIRKAWHVGMFIALWNIVTRELGRAPVTVDEYAEQMELSRSQAFRQQQLFRQAFPEYPTPAELWAALEDAPPMNQPDDLLIASLMSARLSR